MIPVRLTLLLFGVLVLVLVALGNPQRVAFNFIFWSPVFELYKIVMGAVAFGIILSLLYTSQWKYLRKVSGRLDDRRIRHRR